jgi:predicted transcriptional regulator
MKQEFANILSRAGAAAEAQGQVQEVMQAIQGLEYGLAQVSNGIQALAQGLDICHFKVHMVLRILGDKGLVTEEELQDRYKQDVTDKIDEIRAQQEAKMKEAMGQAQASMPRRPEPEEPEPAEESNDTAVSDVVLPSEREDSKVTFGKTQ